MGLPERLIERYKTMIFPFLLSFSMKRANKNWGAEAPDVLELGSPGAVARAGTGSSSPAGRPLVSRLSPLGEPRSFDAKCQN